MFCVVFVGPHSLPMANKPPTTATNVLECTETDTLGRHPHRHRVTFGRVGNRNRIAECANEISSPHTGKPRCRDIFFQHPIGERIWTVSLRAAFCVVAGFGFCQNVKPIKLNLIFFKIFHLDNIVNLCISARTATPYISAMAKSRCPKSFQGGRYARGYLTDKVLRCRSMLLPLQKCHRWHWHACEPRSFP